MYNLSLYYFFCKNINNNNTYLIGLFLLLIEITHIANVENIGGI